MSGNLLTNQTENEPVNNTSKGPNNAGAAAVSKPANGTTDKARNGAAKTSDKPYDEISKGIPGRRCRGKAAFCMVDTFEYKFLKELMFANLSMLHPNEKDLKVKFEAMFDQHDARMKKLTPEEYKKEFPC
jgi:hypothetical protein